MGKQRRKQPAERVKAPDTAAMARRLVQRGLCSRRILDGGSPQLLSRDADRG